MPTPSSPSVVPSFVPERRRRPKQKRSRRAREDMDENSLVDVSVSQLPVPASLDDRIEEGSLVFGKRNPARDPILFEDIPTSEGDTPDVPPKRKRKASPVGAAKPKKRLAKSNPPFSPSAKNAPRPVLDLDVTPPPSDELDASVGGIVPQKKPEARARRRRKAAAEAPPVEQDASLAVDDSEVDVALAMTRARASNPTENPKRVKRAAKKAKKTQVATDAESSSSRSTGAERAGDVKTKTRRAAEVARVILDEAGRAKSSTVPFEVLGVALLASSVLTFLSLASYTAADPGFGQSADGDVVNWIGPVGAWAADAFTLFFGIGAWGIPLVCLLLAVSCFRRRFLRPRWHQVLGGLVGAAGVVCLLDVLFAESGFFPFPPGGLFGALLARSAAAYIYALGTGVLAFVAAAVGILLAFDRSIGHILRTSIDIAHSGVAWAKEQLEVHREQQRLLEEERDRLIEEVTIERAERRSARDEQRESRKDRAQQRAEVLARAALDDTGILAAASATAGASGLDESSAHEAVPHDVATLRPVPRKSPRDPAWARAGVDPAALELDASMRLGAVVPANDAFSIRAPVDTGESLESHLARAGIEIDDDTTEESAVPTAVKVAAVEAAEAKAAAKAAAADDDAAEGLRIVERDAADAKKAVTDDDEDVEATGGEYELPPLKLLDYDAPDLKPVDPEKARTEAAKLVKTFGDFGIDGRVREIRPGPIVTTYEFVPAPGIKVSRIAALSDDIAMAMEAVHVRIVAPIPGKGAVGIEIPNEKRETVYLKEVIADERFRKSKDNKLQMAIGKDIEGRAYHANLGEMPHVLISGTTGSGKSVSVNAMICSILYRARPDEVKFLMIDPKMLELSIYDGIPHLLLPPIIDTTKAANALRWTVGEMEQRYKQMSNMGVRDVAGYNQALIDIKNGEHEQHDKIPVDEAGKAYKKLPYIVVIIDEYADLLQTAGKEVEGYVMRLAQKARAAGIHVMLATQRPSVDVITGVIKANFPVRMGFRLASNHDSKTIINRPGAEKLLGRGDMLILPAGTSEVTRVHGAYISEKELHRVIEHLKQQGSPNYDLSITEAPPSEDAGGGGGGEALDAKWDDAIAVVAKSRRCSTSWIQRQLGIGYNRAARIVEKMEREGLVGPQLNSKGDRDIHVPSVG